MMVTKLAAVRRLRNDELMAQTLALAKVAREQEAELLVHIAEVDRRKLYREKAYASMYQYCVDVLGFSESAAYRRIRVARLGRLFPQAFEVVADGRMHATGLALLAPILRRKNFDALVKECSGKTKRQIEVVLAREQPQADKRDRIAGMWASGAAGATGPQQQVEALSEDRYCVRFTVSGALRDKIEQAQDLLRHVTPSGSLEIVFERALDLLIITLTKRKFGAASGRGSVAPGTSGRRVPNGIRHAVAQRDGLRCAFRAADGVQCSETGMLELHHIHPFAKGGAHTTENVALYCRAHNQLMADREFGQVVSR